ncbi:hypothetical protein D5272_07290 [bacterium D16-76]|nr:hypothetical protein [bacterium D16-76]
MNAEIFFMAVASFFIIVLRGWVVSKGRVGKGLRMWARAFSVWRLTKRKAVPHAYCIKKALHKQGKLQKGLDKPLKMIYTNTMYQYR